MNTSKTEFLSAFLDDEAGEFEQRRLLNELKKDEELGQAFTRYALIGEAIRTASNGQRSTLGVSLLSGIQAELEDEPAYLSVPTQTTVPPLQNVRPARSFRSVSMALAATVAAVAVGGLLFMQQQPPAAVEQQVQAPVSVPVNANTMVADAGATEERIRQVGRVDPQTRDILKQYVAQHVKYASTTAFAPSIRAVSYANEQ